MAKTQSRDALAEKFARRLGAIMNERGLKPDDLVRRSPVLKSAAVNRWLAGARFPQPRSIVDLAKALDMTPDELFGGIQLPLRMKVEVDAITRAMANAP